MKLFNFGFWLAVLKLLLSNVWQLFEDNRLILFTVESICTALWKNDCILIIHWRRHVWRHFIKKKMNPFAYWNKWEHCKCQWLSIIFLLYYMYNCKYKFEKKETTERENELRRFRFWTVYLKKNCIECPICVLLKLVEMQKSIRTCIIQ